jgi:Putative prokaryotic signal transducing protein
VTPAHKGTACTPRRDYNRGMDDLQVIRTFINNVDAELARGALEAAGIESMIRADDCGGTRPHLWMGGVELLVRQEDLERAEEVLGIEPTATESPDAPAR